jgi:hypothetical protein
MKKGLPKTSLFDAISDESKEILSNADVIDRIGPYQVTMEPNGTHGTLHQLPLFDLGVHRSLNYDEVWAKGIIKNHNDIKRIDGWVPPVIQGHNIEDEHGNRLVEKESFGHVDNMSVVDRVRKSGAKVRTLVGDLIKVPVEMLKKLKRGAFPSHSVEATHASRRLMALALLGGSTPHHKFTPSHFSAMYFDGESMKTEKAEVFVFEDNGLRPKNKINLTLDGIRSSVIDGLVEILGDPDKFKVKDVTLSPSLLAVTEVDGRLYAHPFSVSEDGDVTVDAKGAEVEQRYVSVMDEQSTEASTEKVFYEKTPQGVKHRRDRMDEILKYREELLQSSHELKVAKDEIEALSKENAKFSEELEAAKAESETLKSQLEEAEGKVQKYEEAAAKAEADAFETEKKTILDAAQEGEKITKRERDFLELVFTKDNKDSISEYLTSLEKSESFSEEAVEDDSSDEEGQKTISFSDAEKLAEERAGGNIEKMAEEMDKILDEFTVE